MERKRSHQLKIKEKLQQLSRSEENLVQPSVSTLIRVFEPRTVSTPIRTRSSSTSRTDTDKRRSVPSSRSRPKDRLNDALAELLSISKMPNNSARAMLSDNRCANCHQTFGNDEQIVNAAGQVWHTQCFVCAQCFQPFDRGIFFEHENRKYCEKDFQLLFAPCCGECKKPIVGRVIRAVQKCFHPDCFRCQDCRQGLIDIGFTKSQDKILCRECHGKGNKSRSNPLCSTCQQPIEHQALHYQGQLHHSSHFRCTSCRMTLDENAREVRTKLYCSECYQKLDLPVCSACRRLIDDRVISALGKQWHVEHFCCSRCAQPFRGSKHFENKGLPFCEMDYHVLFGSTCFTCSRIITEGAYTACNKKYCADHFACSICETKMNEKSKFFDVDATPVCKTCYGKLPMKSRKSLEQSQKKKKSVISIFNK